MACWAFRLVVLEYVSQLEHPIIPCSLCFSLWYLGTHLFYCLCESVPLKLDRSDAADHIFQH